jgi:Tol biopolymer transport system component/DNA-binding winged helix-turn-helix (wHTH) protein
MRGGETIPVEPKAFRVLLFLLENPHRLVTKDELLDAVWQETSVSENSLTRSIALLRKLLGDDTHEPRFIATVPTVGYRFVADVTESEETLRASNGGRAIAKDDSQRLRGGKWRSAKLVIAGCLGLMVLAGLIVGARSWLSARHHAQNAISVLRSTTLVSVPGRILDPALSPDGRAMVFVWDGENPGRGDVYVQLIGGEKPLRLTHTVSGFVCCGSWSPDGRQIAFALCDDQGGSVLVIPALGGPQRKVSDAACLYGAGGWPMWMPDGKSLIVSSVCEPGGRHGLVLLTLATGEKECLTTAPGGEIGDWRPALSPDRKRVAFSRTGASRGDIYTLSLQDGQLHRLTAEGKSIWGFMWAADGQHIIFSSSRSGLAAMWRVPAGGGAIEREAIYPEVGSLSADGRRLIYVRDIGSRPTTILRADLSTPGGSVLDVKQLISSANENDSPQLSPDGRQLVYGSGPAGYGGWGGEVWKSDADGSDPVQMTSYEGHTGTPRWSPDGKFIAFDNRNELRSQIYVMDADARNQRRLTSGNYDHVVPSWSRDGRFIYYASNQTGAYEVWKHELDTRREIQVTRHGGFGSFEGYDGKTLYYCQFDGAGIWEIPIAGGEERRITAAPHLGYWGYFAMTEPGIYLLDTQGANAKAVVRFYDFRTHRLTPVLTLEQDPLPWGANLWASRDGRTLLFAQYKVTSAMTMMEYRQ